MLYACRGAKPEILLSHDDAVATNSSCHFRNQSLDTRALWGHM